ncbi:sigma factor-like helix-turn-helix DNA-binding protein [Sphingomonas panacis]|nr:sigma-70 region 4 domain-containing protein [Sphingomonas panacis]
MTNDPQSPQDRARHAYQRTIGAVEPASVERPDPETLRKLEAAVASMPRLRREIFLAVRLDALTYAQIAEVTGLSVAQVERHMARAMRHLVCMMSDRPARKSWWRRWLRL